MSAESEFEKSLAERLVKVGEENVSKADRKSAMENLASAFTDPVAELIRTEAVAASAGVISSDGTVGITAVTEGERAYSDLSVAAAIAEETLERQIADEDLRNMISSSAPVQSDWAEDDQASKAFIKNKIVPISDAEIAALE